MASPTSPYTTVTISGYNSSPPPDDGSQTSDNRLNWSKHKDKLADPLKTLAEGINSAVVAAFGAMAVTSDPAEETIIVMAEEFVKEPTRPPPRAPDPADENRIVMAEEFV